MSSRRATNGRPLLTRTCHKYIIRKRHTTEVGGPALIHDRSAVRAEHHTGEHSGFSRFCRMTARPPCRSRGVRDCLYPDRASAVSLPRRDNGAAQNVGKICFPRRKENSAASRRKAYPLRCPMFTYGVMPATLMFSRMSAGHFLQRQRKVTICALVQSASGLNVVLVVPLVIFSLTAHSTASA